MTLTQTALDQLYLDAHTASSFLPQPVPADVLQQIYDLAKMGPTSMNTQPARFVFLTTPEAKARLLPALSPGNVEKTRVAPVTVIVAMDTRFFEHLPQTFPNNPNARAVFEGNEALIHDTAFRNSSLTGAYFILAARALGLDCGPMSGFDSAKLNAEFFPDGRYRANFLINLGVADRTKFHPRNPRLTFAQACSVL